MWPIILLLLSILLIVFLTNRLKLHPFFSLILAAFFYGSLNSNISLSEVIISINNGFGKTLGYIGIVILAGSIIGKFLENSGGAFRMADYAYRKLGKKRVTWANGILGYIISIPVFCDAAFIILSPLSRSLAKRAAVPVASCAISLSLGLYLTHSMVPPTPGPVAAAGIIEADLGLIIIFAIIVSIAGLVAGVTFAKYAGRKVILPYEEVSDNIPDLNKTPGVFKSIIPILLPLILIILRSISNYPSHPFGGGMLIEILDIIGQPVVALIIGALISFGLPAKFEKGMLSSSGWVGEAVTGAAGIIVITGAGGAFGQVLKDSGIGDVIQDNLTGLEGIGIWLPFIIASALKTAQGSSTVAIITTAGLVAPMLPVLGLDDPNSRALAVIAIGAGSMMISHTNDSFFWVVSQMTKLNLSQGLKLQSLGSVVVGLVTGFVVWILNMLF